MVQTNKNFNHLELQPSFLFISLIKVKWSIWELLSYYARPKLPDF